MSQSTPVTHQGQWVLAATIIGSSMAFIDGAVVNVALPILQEDLNASVSQLQWIVEAYALFLAALLLVGGSLGDHFGRRRIFAIGIVIFAITSMWAGLAPTANQLILARGVQGVGGALLVPGSLAIISTYFDDLQRGQAIGTWSGFSAITTAFGPVLGGWLVDNLSWRWVFFINLPLAIITLLILFRYVPESRNEETESLDWWGSLLATLGLGGVVFALVESANLGWGHPLVISALVIGTLSIILFLIIEARIPHPMMPLALFRSPIFSGANLLTLLLYISLNGVLFFLPFNLIQVQGYSATAAGAALLPAIILIFLLSQQAGALAERYGAQRLLIIGPIIVGVGYLLFPRPSIGGSYWVTFFPAITLLGVGMGLTVAPLTTAVMGSVSIRYSGIASGINNAISRTAVLLAIAVLGIVILGVFNQQLDEQLAPLNLSSETLTHLDSERVRLANAQPPSGLTHETTAAITTAVNVAFVAGFRRVMLICAILAFASAAIAARTLGSTKPT